MADNIKKISSSCNEDDFPVEGSADSTNSIATTISTDATTKWLCDYCTYSNYPSALKCVMCKGQKTSLDIFRLNNKNLAATHEHILDSEHLFLNCDDIEPDLGLGTANTSAPLRQKLSPANARTAVFVGTDEKWSCVVCTYLNWPIALRCIQCLTERDKSSSPLLDATNTEEDLLTAAAEHLQRTLTIRSSPDGGGVGGGGAVSRKKLLASPTATTTSVTCYSVVKWQCLECTYENFPKSQKCSMCGAGRKGVASCASPTDTTNFNNNVNVHNNNNKNNSSRSHSNSPARISPTPISAAAAAATGGGGASVTPTIEATGGIHSGSVSPPHTSSLTRKKPQQQQQHKMDNNNSEERQLLRKLRKHGDWRWLHACLGVVENNFTAVEEYLSYGGSPGRALTQAEVSLLNRNSAFDVGFTLIHLAIRFQREDMLPMMLSQISGTGSGVKRVPSYVAPDIAADIRRQFSTLLRVSRKGQFNCHYVKEHATFALPSEIEDLPVAVQDQLYEELLDKDAQKQLENPPPVLNWSLEITVRLGSRLVVLWNRSAGDCLLDSTMQATWGIFDRDNVLRRALADSLHQCGHL